MLWRLYRDAIKGIPVDAPQTCCHKKDAPRSASEFGVVGRSAFLSTRLRPPCVERAVQTRVEELAKRRVEFRAQIGDIFHADRQADQTIADAEPFAIRRRH